MTCVCRTITPFFYKSLFSMYGALYVYCVHNYCLLEAPLHLKNPLKHSTIIVMGLTGKTVVVQTVPQNFFPFLFLLLLYTSSNPLRVILAYSWSLVHYVQLSACQSETPSHFGCFENPTTALTTRFGYPTLRTITLGLL